MDKRTLKICGMIFVQVFLLSNIAVAGDNSLGSEIFAKDVNCLSPQINIQLPSFSAEFSLIDVRDIIKDYETRFGIEAPEIYKAKVLPVWLSQIADKSSLWQAEELIFEFRKNLILGQFKQEQNLEIEYYKEQIDTIKKQLKASNGAGSIQYDYFKADVLYLQKLNKRLDGAYDEELNDYVNMLESENAYSSPAFESVASRIQDMLGVIRKNYMEEIVRFETTVLPEKIRKFNAFESSVGQQLSDTYADWFTGGMKTDLKKLQTKITKGSNTRVIDANGKVISNRHGISLVAFLDKNASQFHVEDASYEELRVALNKELGSVVAVGNKDDIHMTIGAILHPDHKEEGKSAKNVIPQEEIDVKKRDFKESTKKVGLQMGTTRVYFKGISITPSGRICLLGYPEIDSKTKEDAINLLRDKIEGLKPNKSLEFPTFAVNIATFYKVDSDNLDKAKSLLKKYKKTYFGYLELGQISLFRHENDLLTEGEVLSTYNLSSNEYIDYGNSATVKKIKKDKIYNDETIRSHDAWGGKVMIDADRMLKVLGKDADKVMYLYGKQLTKRAMVIAMYTIALDESIQISVDTREYLIIKAQQVASLVRNTQEQEGLLNLINNSLENALDGYIESDTDIFTVFKIKAVGQAI